VYRNRPVLYGCGDFVNDYEGIEGYEPYRDDLVLMYFATLSRTTGRLIALRMTPMQIRRLAVNRPSAAEAAWARDALERASAPFGSHVDMAADGTLTLGGW
jgi:poly-gamma-glutamate capsule biosynthesis protein CapA/YwtB (metallophosphatase superfamily)